MIQKHNTTFEPCVKVYALGGLDENGKDMYCIETPDSIFIIETGSKYPDLSNPGVDIIIPDVSYLEQNKEKVKAIIISHGHDDVYGALPYVIKKLGSNIPIYTTETTRIIITADYGAKSKNLNFHIIKPSDDILIDGYPFHFFETTHAVMESFGFSVETQAGNIVYTGNYISDFGTQGHFSFDISKAAKIAEENKTLLMLCESIGAERPGIASPTHKLTPHIKSLIEEGEKRVFVACYNQNLYIISEVIKLAIANHKKLVITNNRFLDSLPSFILNGDFIIPRANQCSFDEIASLPPQDIIVLITGTGEELFNSIIDLCRGQNKHNSTLHIEQDDAFVLACPPAPSLETLATEAEDALFKTDCQVLNLKRSDISSMHAQQEDIKMMVSIFHPKYYMPVEGEFRLLMANAKVAESLGYSPSNIFLLDNGMSLGFDRAGNALNPVVQLFKPNSIFVDGLGVGDVKTNIIDERTTMSEAGVICLSALYSSSKKKLVGSPKVEIKGFVTPKDSESVLKQINIIFNQYLNHLLTDANPDPVLIQNKMIETMSQEMKKSTNKLPLICPTIVDVDNIQ